MLKINRILYPTDFSPTAWQALDPALYLAELFEAELHLLHTVVLHDYDPRDPAHQFPEPSDILRRLFEIAESEMAGIVDKNKAKTFTIREATERGFAAGEVILDYSQEHDIDLIAMGTHGRRGPARFFLGSVAEEVVRHARCPVLTLRERKEPRQFEGLEKILVGVDFSEHSKQALALARELASRLGARLLLYHAIEEPPLPYFYAPIGGLSVTEHLEELAKKSEEELDRLIRDSEGPEVPYENLVTSGRPSTETARLAREHDADLIVIATHGLTGVERMLMGSTAEEVIRHAECPVLTLKSFGKSLL